MKMNNNGSTLKVAGIAAGITCLLFGSGFLVVLTPFPLYFVSTVYGKRAGGITALISLAAALCLYMFGLPLLKGMAGSWPLAQVIFFLPGTGLIKFFNLGSAQYFGMLYISYFMLFGYLFSEGMLKRWSLTRWFVTSVGATFIFLCLAFLALEFAGVSVVTGLKGYMQGVLNEVIAAQEAAGMTDARLVTVKENAAEILKFSLYVMPSVILLMGLLVAAANQAVARWMIRVPALFKHFGDVTRFCVPHYLTWAAIAFGSIYFLDSYLVHSVYLKFFAINCLVVLGGIYFLQGIVIVSFYLNRVNKRWLRFAAYGLMLMFIQFTAPVAIIIGFSDLWVDFRRIVVKKHQGSRTL